jgi:hypothetical protein
VPTDTIWGRMNRGTLTPMAAIVKFSILGSVGAVLALLAVSAAAVATPASETKRRPVLSLLDDGPVSVAGRGFARGERVTVRTAVSGRTFAQTVRATRAGRFTATFTEADAACQPFTVTAVGRAGSRATFRRIEIPPPCGPPIQP